MSFNVGNILPDVPLFLDDGPRFRGKNTTDRDITIFKKGRSIVHHLPFKWMGYHHPTGPNVKVKEIINYKCDTCGMVESNDKQYKKHGYFHGCDCPDDHGLIEATMKPTKTPLKVKFLFWKIRLPYFVSDHIMIKPRY